MATEFLLPPDNSIYGKLRRVSRLPYSNVTQIMSLVVNAIRNSFACGIAGKIVGIDLLRFLTPLLTTIIEKTNQLFFLGIHTDARPTISAVVHPNGSSPH